MATRNHPRVGEQYQAEIPPLMSLSNYNNIHKHQYIGMLRGSSSSNSWNEKDEANFILGLYIFGKSFDQIKRFIGNKNMGDILSFYYGKEFYKSEKYRRWRRLRKKSKSLKCIFGEKIFQLPSRQKLLSRLQNRVTQGCYITILEVTWLYAEAKMNLEDYVLTLSKLVGLKTLVRVIGIGKGKKDLTGFNKENSSQTLQVGEDFSRLTHTEIIKLLRHFKLRRAESSDLFKKAVWPRLQVRGWHSEQVKRNRTHGELYFIPGVEKFSRDLVKGNHYFDSIRGVLRKVRSNPEMIEIPTVVNAKKKRCREEFKLSGHNYYTDEMKFTVVDTCMDTRKDLRSLPVGVAKAFYCVYANDNVDTQQEQENAHIVREEHMEKAVAIPSTFVASEVQHNGNQVENNSRRKSTRKKLPTVRKLEALANGDYPNGKQKKRKHIQESSMPMPSRHRRS